MICSTCHTGFKTEWDGIRCDSCLEPTHRDGCGDYRTFQTPNEVLAHFLCDSCLDVKDFTE